MNEPAAIRYLAALATLSVVMYLAVCFALLGNKELGAAAFSSIGTLIGAAATIGAGYMALRAAQTQLEEQRRTAAKTRLDDAIEIKSRLIELNQLCSATIQQAKDLRMALSELAYSSSVPPKRVNQARSIFLSNLEIQRLKESIDQLTKKVHRYDGPAGSGLSGACLSFKMQQLSYSSLVACMEAMEFSILSDPDDVWRHHLIYAINTCKDIIEDKLVLLEFVGRVRHSLEEDVDRLRAMTR